MSRTHRIFTLALLPLLPALLANAASRATEGDDYLTGYAAAVVERDLGLDVVRIEIREGSARVTVRDLEDVAPQRIVEALTQVRGIERVEVRVADDGENVAVSLDDDDPDHFEFLPRQELFEPLLADPREPHFSASALWYLDDPELTHVGSANFGETFPLMGGALDGNGTRWEVGLLGAVFSIFDLDAESYDLVNADYWAAATFSLRRDLLSTRLRVYHQSSHLGDEYLLRNQVDRENVSYEGADLTVSLNLHSSVRVYLGGSGIFHDDTGLDPWSGQTGIELRSPYAFFGGVLRPIAAGDVQFREENDWDEEIGAVAGFQVENPKISPLQLQILVEYFRGNSPNGQFFERRIEYLGAGAHLRF